MFRGRPARSKRIDVGADQDPAEVQRLAQAAIARLDDGTACWCSPMSWAARRPTAATSSPAAADVEVIAGISLPMLLRAITYRNDTLDVVAQMALAGGQSGAVRVDHRIRLSIN